MEEVAKRSCWPLYSEHHHNFPSSIIFQVSQTTNTPTEYFICLKSPHLHILSLKPLKITFKMSFKFSSFSLSHWYRLRHWSSLQWAVQQPEWAHLPVVCPCANSYVAALRCPSTSAYHLGFHRAPLTSEVSLVNPLTTHALTLQAQLESYGL